MENHFGYRHGKKNGAHHGVQAEEGDVDPTEAATAGNPMFQHQTDNDDQPADEVGEAEVTEQSKAQQQSAHDHVREECGGQRVFRAPRHDERVQSV